MQLVFDYVKRGQSKTDIDKIRGVIICWNRGIKI